MSNIDTNLNLTAKDLFVDLDQKDAETVSGGAQEVFTILNETKYDIPYSVDGTRTKAEFAKPNTSSVWTTYDGGIIKFDRDGRTGVKDFKTYNLSDGGIYVFKDNKNTPGNPYDFELYKRA